MADTEEALFLGINVDSSFLRQFFASRPNTTALTFGAATTIENPENIVRVLQSNRKITCLRFGKLANTSDGNAIAENVGKLLRFRSNLKVLQFEGCLTEAGFVAIGKVLQQYPSTDLTLLDLDEKGAGELPVEDRSLSLSEGAMSLARGIEMLTSLKKLYINVTAISATGTCQILNAMCKNRSIEKLALGRVQANAEVWNGLARLLHGNDTLKLLVFKSSLVGHSGGIFESCDLSLFATALARNTKLEELVLDHWEFDAPSFHAVVDGLIQNQTLKEIHLRGNRLDANSMKEICRLVSGRKTKMLDITDNGISDDLIVPLCEALRRSEGLEHLKLSHNGITDTGAKHLADVLRVNPKLEELVLTNHVMSDQGCIALAKALEANNTLKWLSLASGEDNITLQGIQALVNGVEKNHELIELDLPNPEQWPVSITKRLQVYMERNKVLTPLLKADLPLSVWPYVMEQTRLFKSTSRDMLYALVKEKCDLFRSVPQATKRPRKRRRTRR